MVGNPKLLDGLGTLPTSGIRRLQFLTKVSLVGFKQIPILDNPVLKRLSSFVLPGLNRTT